MRTTLTKLGFAAALALGLGLSTVASAATIGSDFSSVGFTYLKSQYKKNKQIDGMLRVENSSEQSEVSAFETLFGMDDIVVWDKVEVGYFGWTYSQLDRIDLDLNWWDGNKSGTWSIDDDATDFNAASIVGFAVKAGKYTGYFKLDNAGIELNDIVAFASMDEYAEELFGDQSAYNSKHFKKAVSHLTVFGSTTIGNNITPVTAVPVPPSVAMLALALLGFGVLSWRRKRML